MWKVFGVFSVRSFPGNRSGLEKKNSNFSKTVEVVLNKESALGKIKQLATISGQDAKFCQNFYLAQLSKEQASSEEMILFRIKQAIFSF